VRWVFDAEMRAIAAGLAGRQALSYGIYGVAFTLLQADTLIVGVIGGAAMVAEFVLVWKIAEIVLLLLWKFPESLQPYLIASDVRGDRVHINDQYRMLIKWVPLAGLLAGLGYGLLGHRLVGLWVGAANVPAHQWYFVAAGGAVFWLAMARVFTLFAYTLKHFAPLNRALVAEVGAKILLIVLLVPVVGAGAPMLAVNLVHVLVMAWVYLWLGRLYFRGAQSAD
jgi:O-antigen/teichoic acid export membrane protein